VSEVLCPHQTHDSDELLGDLGYNLPDPLSAVSRQSIQDGLAKPNQCGPEGQSFEHVAATAEATVDHDD
jgi:hypothetical protein